MNKKRILLRMLLGITIGVGLIFHHLLKVHKTYRHRQTFYEKYIKRGFDIVCCLFILISFWWLYLIVAILVKVRLGAPVIFTQLRPGKDEKIFKVYKFRSMTDEKDDNGNFLSDEKRLTSFGKKLRSSSLDELPEIFNILKGDMSLVGPRPQLVRDVLFMSDEQRRRHNVRPGLSGLAQVNGRNNISWEEKLNWDLKYIDHITFFGDLKIMFQTVLKAFIRQENITEGDMATAEDFGDYLLNCGKISLEEYENKQLKAVKCLHKGRIDLEGDDMIEKHVSVITPAYNAEKYIGKAIESVLSQSYQNWEMIIVDDGSKDRTVDIVKRYSDSRIKLHCLEKNSGVAVAMNTAIELAQGPLIAFLDADDIWKPQKLERQVNFMVSNGYGFTFSAYEIIKEKKNKFVKAPKAQNYGQYMRNTVIGTSAAMLDLDIIGHDFRMVNLRKDLDSMTWAKLLREGHKAYGLNESLALYRKVETSISNDKWKAATNHWENCRKIEHLSFFKCLYYFIGYAFNATLKHFF